MQLFVNKKVFIIECFILFSVICFFTPTHVHAAEETVIHSIHIEWTYDDNQMSNDGFRLYQEDTVVCDTVDKNLDPSVRAMNCEFVSQIGTYHFYLAAYSEDDESPLSAPFSFTLQAPIDPVAELSTNISSGPTPLTVTLDAGESQGAIKGYIWTFGDGTGSTWTRGSTTSHTYYTIGQHTAIVTVVDLNQNRDSKSIVITTAPQEIPSSCDAPISAIRISETNGTAPFSVSFDGLDSTGGSGEITNYIWNFNDDSPRKQGATPVHSYSIPGTYHPTLTVVNSQGIHHSSSVTIVVAPSSPGNESPKARFTTTLVELDDTLVIEFDASSSLDPDGSIENCTWRFGNSGFQSGSNVTHTFPANKVTSISLTVTDDAGSQHTVTMSTITFLKAIHGNVINLINSFLLNKKHQD